MLSGRRNNRRSWTPAIKLDAGKTTSVCLCCTTTDDIMRPCSDKRRKAPLQLPEEMIFNILVLLPAPILYNSMRLVCKQWNRIIHDPTFIREHLVRAPYLLFSKPISASYLAHYIDVDERVAMVRLLDHQFPGVDVVDHCDGLILVRCSKDEGIICYVANPVTKQRIILPPLPLSLLRNEKPPISLVPMTSAAEYKVVCVYLRGNCSARIFVLSLGKDVKWKEILSEHLSTTPLNHFFPRPLATEGYINWASNGHNRKFTSLDVETETLHELVSPLKDRPNVLFSYMKMKNKLCCVYMIGLFSFGVLLLTDPKSGVWTKLYEVAHVPWLMFPIAWVGDGDIIVLYDNEKFMVYNVKAKCSYKFNLNFPPSYYGDSNDRSLYRFYSFHSHVESLVLLSKL